MAYQPIENYGVIGDLNTVALVGMDGSLDFLCFPRFDSPSVFAALLDDEKGGRFRIAPTFDVRRHQQLYLPDTNILLTRFLSEDGVAELTDFMSIEEEMGHAHNVLRRVTAVRGEITFRLVCQPRFDYGRAGHKVERRQGEVLFISEGPDQTRLRLRTRVPVEIQDGAAVAEFKLAAGECETFILEQMEQSSELPSASNEYWHEAMAATTAFWRRWLARSRYQGRWREIVNRAALVLKMLVYQPTGAIVAAPTFSLPEAIGGSRNWDYRYTWIRDSAYTVWTLGRLGYVGEVVGFMDWVLARLGEVDPSDGGAPPLQVMYGVDGRRGLEEEVLGGLEGYRGSRPVRIGNAAHGQLQLDIYGELLDAVFLYDRDRSGIPHRMWGQIVHVVDWVCANWEQPDEGIWEVRGGSHEFLHSRLMCWVAIDRALRIAMNRSLPAPVEKWRQVRDRIHQGIYRDYWDPKQGAFVQYKGGTTIDASSLQMPIVKFIPFRDPLWLSHLKVIEKRLVDDNLVHRYRDDGSAPDGVGGQEGTFSMCSFWYVENLTRAGHLNRARFLFENLHSYANHLGLYSEEFGTTGEQVGNFPQAFTHLGLITAAMRLDQALDRAGHTI